MYMKVPSEYKKLYAVWTTYMKKAGTENRSQVLHALGNSAIDEWQNSP